MGSQSADEARLQYVAQMGSELGIAYDTLRNDVTWCFVLRDTYHELFGTPERIDLLSSVAGTFFWILQRTLLDDMVLRLAKLVESPSTAGRDNLTLQRLPQLVVDPRLRADVEALVEVATDKCKAAVLVRNKQIAHRDLDVALTSVNAALPEISFSDVTDALDSFAALLNRLESHFNNGASVMYDHVTIQGGGVESLAYFLDRGLRAEQCSE